MNKIGIGCRGDFVDWPKHSKWFNFYLIADFYTESWPNKDKRHTALQALKEIFAPLNNGDDWFKLTSDDLKWFYSIQEWTPDEMRKSYDKMRAEQVRKTLHNKGVL